MRTLNQVSMGEGDRAAIIAAAARLRASLPVDRIVVFGSKARGDDHVDSDIDLLVLTTRELTPEEAGGVVAMLYPIQLERDVLLSTIVVWREDWERGMYQVLPLRVEIERDGVAA